MCMFCAAIPATAAVGAKMNARQNAEFAAAEGETARKKPVKAITVGVIVMLAIGSVIYHTHFSTFI